MASISEWISGTTHGGEHLPIHKVNAYRRMQGLPAIEAERRSVQNGSQKTTTPPPNGGKGAVKPERQLITQCIHRGDPVRRMTNWPCTCDKTVYACAIKTICVKRAPATIGLAVLQAAGITDCSRCEERCSP